MLFSSAKFAVGFLFGLAINVVLSTVKQGKENVLAKLMSRGFTSTKYIKLPENVVGICQMVTILILAAL